MEPRLYAWGSPAQIPGIAADHTWVTSYDAPYSVPPPSMFWYCWGEQRGAGPDHPGSTKLADTAADIELACRIAQPDDARADCGVRYGRDGVCHQMANRILLASTTEPKPVVVGARYYGLSVLLYGPYGRNFETWASSLGIGGAP